MTEPVRIGDAELWLGDCREILPRLPNESVHCVVTSPPYFGLRDYGVSGQIGLEQSPEDYISGLVGVFHAVRRVLRADGTLWLNLGDTYKAKNLLGIPWRVALALQADGWFLRSEIIWHKPAAMPENVSDRPTRAHEHVFLLSKSQAYFYDADCVRTPYTHEPRPRKRWQNGGGSVASLSADKSTSFGFVGYHPLGANLRDVWKIDHGARAPKGGHFATFPHQLVERCVSAGCPVEGTVLDPFGGAGTTGLVANRLGRKAVLIELNPEYLALAHQRIETASAQPSLLPHEAVA